MFQSAFCNLLFLVTGMLFGNSSVPDLREGHEAVKRVRQKMMWRYRPTGSRCKAVPRRCRGDVVRCAATRRQTRDTSDCCAGEDREKRPGFRVNSGKWFALFQCSVNWARARLRTSLIAGGAPRSSSICAETSIEQCSSGSWFSDGLLIRLNPLRPSDIAVHLDTGCSNHSVCKLHLVDEYLIMKNRLTRSVCYRIAIPPTEKTYL